MDPPALMNEGSYNLSEIWPFPINAGGDSGESLGLRMPQFGPGPGHLGDLSGDDPMSLDHRACHGPARKRRDLDDGDDDEDGGGGSAKGVSSSSANGVVTDCDGKRLKSSVRKDSNREAKGEAAEPSSGKAGEQNARPPDPMKLDYIHVRARRGQATDSHSLAERARREKISERMKILQDLVPGCNKVIGKALVLDEIINYIQSLQRQVEFLSMKLEAVNSRIPTGIEVFPSKDINLGPQFGQQTFEATGMGFGSQTQREYSRGSSPDWLHMQVGGGFDRTS